MAFARSTDFIMDFPFPIWNGLVFYTIEWAWNAMCVVLTPIGHRVPTKIEEKQKRIFRSLRSERFYFSSFI